MKKTDKSKQKLKLSRETLRQLEAGKLPLVVGGTITLPPCYPSFEESVCTGSDG